MENKIYKFYLIGFFLILCLPLLSLPPWFSPPDWGKMIAFKIILSLMLFAFLWQILYRKTETDFAEKIQSVFNKKSSIFSSFWLLIAFCGISLLATIFSLDPSFSFFNSPNRSGGFLNYIFLVAFALLAFLLIKARDWSKIWNYSIFIGILVSIIAIIQQFGIASEIIKSAEGRMGATIGGPIFLGLYLLLLLFPCIYFALSQKNIAKKTLYLSSALLFVYIILITGSRAAYFGLLVGLFYFLFAYPIKNKARKILQPQISSFRMTKTETTPWLKIICLCGLISSIGLVFVVNNIETREKIPESIQKTKIFRAIAPRMSIDMVKDDPRFSAWKISVQAIKQRPLLGYGPENFSIAFDKFYDPSLPYIDKAWGSWWDKAHNFVFEIAVTTGIPALLIYFCFIGVLLTKLQRLKRAKPVIQENQSEQGREQAKDKQNTLALASHSAMTAFIAYLATNLFAFDVFPTLLLFFLFVAYSFHLINSNSIAERSKTKPVFVPFGTKTGFVRLLKYKRGMMIVAFAGLIWFIWQINIVPAQVQKNINISLFQSKQAQQPEQPKKQKQLLCQNSFERMEKTLPSNSFLNNDLRQQYIIVIKNCAENNTISKKEMANKAISLLQESAKIMPTYTRTWLMLGDFTNILLEKETNLTKNPKTIESLRNKADYNFTKASELSPKHQEIYASWARTNLLASEYQQSKAKTEKCIAINPNFGECWWLLALSHAGLGDDKAFASSRDTAQSNIFNTKTENSLIELMKIYINTENYPKLEKTYLELIKINPENFQYRASLAFVYKQLGEYEKAREQALEALKLDPSKKLEVDEFLKTLK